MPSVQTDIGRAFAAQEEAALRALRITTVKFADVSFPDPAQPPAPSAALTALQGAAVHTMPVTQAGKIDPDNVAYSVFLDTTVGDFRFTQVGYFADDNAGGLVLMMVSNIPPVYKRANGPGQTGNNYRHTDIRQIAGAAAAANVTIPVETWQQDLTALFAAKQSLSEKGVANGYAGLDANSRLAQNVDAAKLVTGTLPAARFNDTAHGARGGGTLHAAATTATNGFMSGADKTKLDGIEAGATADQTAAEILTALKTVDGATSLLDADLLDGQEGAYYQNANNLNAGTLPAARFSDTTHGNRAGGTLHPAATTTVNGFMSGADKTKLDGIEAGATADQTAAEILTALKTVDGTTSLLDADLLDGQEGAFYQNAGNLNAGLLPAARFDDASHGNRAGGTLHPAVSPTVNGFMSSADKTKLDGIEAGATADLTAAEILTALKTVDGTTSLLDADLLDGQEGAFYQNAGNLNAGTLPAARFSDTTHGNRGGGTLHPAATTTVNGFMSSADKTKLDGIEAGATADQTAAEILTALKTVDGAASLLDADLLDGQEGAYYLNASNITSGVLPLAQVPLIPQTGLKTGWGEVQGGNVLLPGGQYGFYPQIKQIGGSAVEVQINFTGPLGLNYVTPISMATPGFAGGAMASQRYIQASPPYDLGEGEVPLFVFALVDGAGKVMASYVAPDPPWANNGPTDIRPTHYRDGKGYQRRRVKPIEDTPEAKLAALRSPEFEEVEVTTAFKNADMALIPHPFRGELPAGSALVLLDPVAALTADLLALHESEESVAILLLQDYLRIDNRALKRRCPPGVVAHGAKWRNTP